MVDGWSRRSVLAAVGGVGVASGTTLTQAASAQLTRRMVIPTEEEFVTDEGYTGYFIHVGEESPDTVTPRDFEGCEFSDWPPDKIENYNGTIIDHIQEDHRQAPTHLFAANEAGIETGSLWVINREIRCPGKHIGIEVEQVGAAVGNVSEDTGTPGTDANPIGQRGFGPIAAVAGVLAGVAALARERMTDEGR